MTGGSNTPRSSPGGGPGCLGWEIHVQKVTTQKIKPITPQRTDKSFYAEKKDHQKFRTVPKMEGTY